MIGVPVRLHSVAGDDLGLVHLPPPVRPDDLAATAHEIYRVTTVVPVPAGFPVAALCRVVPARLVIVAPVNVTWNPENATEVFIGVDETTPKSLGPSGTTTVLVACDDESHEITITPESASGRGETETKTVSAD